jgi:spiro-SPASM protein
MNALAVLYGGSLQEVAYKTVFSGKTALFLALERVVSFPGVQKTVILIGNDPVYEPAGSQGSMVQIIQSSRWTKKSLLDTLAALSQGFDLTYFVWADCPFLDPSLAKAVAERHLRYAAEYSYSDGWPYGLSPEILAPGLAAILSKIIGNEDGPVDRDALFSVIQKDINAFDIETEISPVDLRCHRLSLTADSKRNLLLLTRFAEAGFSGAQDAERIITEQPELLRTLPNFYPIQVAGPCPQTCTLCPYPQFGTVQDHGDLIPITHRKDFLELARFTEIIDRILAFSGDAVIDLSLWGELSLHPEKMSLIQSVLSRPNLSLIIETSGIGWKTGELEALAEEAKAMLPQKNRLAPLSWIVSLDAQDPQRYREVRGAGYTEAVETAKTLMGLFPKDAYIQAVRVKGFEDDIEQFYRFWKAAGANIIIQKYDCFCGSLPALRAADLSPIKRRPCWHLMRDMPILIDGTIPLCREDLSIFGGSRDKRIMGNMFEESLETIWSRSESVYREHCKEEYAGMCAGCDEYYTYNF